jgi:hypothetical protein
MCSRGLRTKEPGEYKLLKKLYFSPISKIIFKPNTIPLNLQNSLFINCNARTASKIYPEIFNNSSYL